MTDEKSLNYLLWIAAVGFFMQTLDSAIVITALPVMAQSLGESPTRMQPVLVAYTLTMAILIPASGWIADKLGTRQAYLAAIILFTVGSLCCAISHTLTQLVGARVLQGIGGALLLPVGRLAILRAFPRERFLRAMSFLTVPGLIGPLVGPALGGWLTQVASWEWIFLINVPIGIIGGVATAIYMPNFRERSGHFDLTGYALLALGMAGVSVALDGLAGFELKTSTVRVLLIIGLASLAGYWLHASRSEQPLFSPALFRVPTFRVGLFGTLFARLGSVSIPFLIPVFLQISLGYSPLEAGMMMMPVALAGIAVKPVAARLIGHIGYRHMLIGNTVMMGTVMASFAAITPELPLWVAITQLAVFGGLNAMQFTAMNTVALKDLSNQEASGGNTLMSMVTLLSLSLGVASAGALLANFENYFGKSSPAQSLPAFHATFVCVGLVTLTSAWIFWRLPKNDGSLKRVTKNKAIG